MELRHLTTFRAVAHASSFTRAATELGYVQSAVTGHIKALEVELGATLFDRLGRTIVLTEAGKRLLDYAERIESLANEVTTVIRGPGEPAGPVLISAPEMLCAHRLPVMIRQLRQHHPQVQVLLRANPSGSLDAELARALTRGQVDLAFVLEEHLDSQGPIAVEPWTEESLVIVAAPHHPLAQANSVDAEDLDGMPLLLTEPGCRYRSVIENALAEAGARPEIVGEFTSSETIKRCAEGDTGLGVLAAVSVTDELAAGTLVALPWQGPCLRIHSYLAWHTTRRNSPMIDAVLHTARAVLRANNHSTAKATSRPN